MLRSCFILMVFAFTIMFTSCKKDKPDTESALQGTWIKGSDTGDTLHFIIRNDTNFLRYNRSFNPAIPDNVEVEYRFQNGRPELKLLSPGGPVFFPLNSFIWNRIGEEFTVQGTELFPFLSSLANFTYHKI